MRDLLTVAASRSAATPVKGPFTDAYLEAWPADRELRADQTPLDLPAVSDAVLRELLSGPAAAAGETPIAMTRTVRRRVTSGLGRTQQFGVALTVAVASLAPTPVPVRWTADGGIVRALSPSTVADRVVESEPVGGGQLPVLEVMSELQRTLGVPAADVLLAAGISRSTYQRWVKNPQRQARLASVNDLWGLAQTVEVLVDEIGAEELPAWLLAEPHRRELLRSRRHRELAREAVTGAAVRGAFADPRGRTLRDRVSLGYDEGEV